MRILPGAAGPEFAPFAAGLSAVQRRLGRHFAPAQDGCAFTSAAVGRAIDWIGAFTLAATGQSSWGPTGFAIVASADEARHAVAAALEAGAIDPALHLVIAAPRNHGAQVEALARAACPF